MLGISLLLRGFQAPVPEAVDAGTFPDLKPYTLNLDVLKASALEGGAGKWQPLHMILPVVDPKNTYMKSRRRV